MRLAGIPFALLAVLFALCGTFHPVAASAQSAMVGSPLSVCISPIRHGDRVAGLFRAPARFDCTTPQTNFEQGDFWAISGPLDSIRDATWRKRVRITSLWQENVTLYALYPDGRILGWAYDGRAATRHLQLGSMIQWELPYSLGTPERLMWRVDGSANLRGILLAPALATSGEAGEANMSMAALYAGFAGLCVALLIYNLAMWAALRHRFQLVYCAMVVALLLYAFTSSGALAWVDPGMLNNDRLRLNYILLAGAAITALIFARTFFPPSVTAGWVGRATNYSIAITALATAVFTLLAPWHIRLLDTAYSLCFATMLVVTGPIIVRAWREGSRHLWLFAAAWAAPIFFAVARLLGNMALIPWSFWLDNSTIVSMTFEAVISTLAITYRIRLLSVERDAAIERELVSAHLADTDPLTGLLNRRAFLRQAIGGSGTQMLMLTDIDHFKRINETIGHDGGDEVLRVFARTLRQAAPTGSLIARMGGEEFAILTPVGRSIAPDTVLDRLRAARMPFDLTVTASIGACEGSVMTEPEWKAMYRRADRALFDAKQAGRDRARFAPIAA